MSFSTYSQPRRRAAVVSPVASAGQDELDDPPDEPEPDVPFERESVR